MLNEPDLQVGGLSIWIDGRERPDTLDSDDANWLYVRARMEASDAIVSCEGAILMTTDFDHFREELASLSETLAGEATLTGFEPGLKVTLKMQRLGQVEGEVEITPDHLNQFHRFTLDLDQSYLPAVLASCEAILERFPVVTTSE
jgi:hypothetical protein